MWFKIGIYIDVDIHGFITKTRVKLQHPPPNNPQHDPHRWNPPVYCQKQKLITYPDTSPLLNPKDKYIIEKIVTLKKYSTTELRQINQVCMFYQRYSNADIFDGKGNKIKRNALLPDAPTETTTVTRPATQPYPADFNIWNKDVKIFQNNML